MDGWLDEDTHGHDHGDIIAAVIYVTDYKEQRLEHSAHLSSDSLGWSTR